jgi:pimeloyl-ACP methyl ester carboxylesterase
MLLGGLASDAMSWLPVLGPLVSRFRVVAPDNRGVGRTHPQDTPASVEAMADDCAALLEHLGVPQAHVVGHSMGGFVAQRLALRHPSRVRSLVLVATGAEAGAANVALFNDFADRLDAGESPEVWFRRMFDAIFTRRFLADPANVDAMLRWALDYPYAQSAPGFRRQCEAIAAFDGRADLGQIAAPVRVIAGREDARFPPAQCTALAGALGTTCVVLDGAAHAVHTEQPRAFVEAVASFCTG